MAPPQSADIPKHGGSLIRTRIAKKTTTVLESAMKSMLPQRVQQRNERERKRVNAVNRGFEELGYCIPKAVTKNKKLSKVQTLRAALAYIKQLSKIVETNPIPSSVPSPNENNYSYSSSDNDSGYYHNNSNNVSATYQTPAVFYERNNSSSTVSPNYAPSISNFYEAYNANLNSVIIKTEHDPNMPPHCYPGQFY
uniref:BHLH domain-containing protein n=1 Tax=Rhabditophanes sp. KR3021 TaxID=114890 RepID=A0AC35TMU1_9BILA